MREKTKKWTWRDMRVSFKESELNVVILCHRATLQQEEHSRLLRQVIHKCKM